MLGDTPDGTLFWDGETCEAQKNAVIETYEEKAVRTDCRFFLTEFFNSEKKIRAPKQICQIIFRYKNALRESA